MTVSSKSLLTRSEHLDDLETLQTLGIFGGAGLPFAMNGWVPITRTGDTTCGFVTEPGDFGIAVYLRAAAIKSIQVSSDGTRGSNL
jgi:hypothetical protein